MQDFIVGTRRIGKLDVLKFDVAFQAAAAGSGTVVQVDHLDLPVDEFEDAVGSAEGSLDRGDLLWKPAQRGGYE
ncbi:UNVERIFIED_CONTAM: hypothetical protein IGO34_33355 [Salmonella enterica subsp. enterica serovar Weltevreden]